MSVSVKVYHFAIKFKFLTKRHRGRESTAIFKLLKEEFKF